MLGITLLASGLSSSTTATAVGQVIMGGMLGRRMNLWVCRIVTRMINTIPTTIAILAGIEPILILGYSQVALSLLLTLALLSLLIFKKDKKLLGTFVNRQITTILAGIFIGSIILLNALFLYLSFGGKI